MIIIITRDQWESSPLPSEILMRCEAVILLEKDESFSFLKSRYFSQEVKFEPWQLSEQVEVAKVILL